MLCPLLLFRGLKESQFITDLTRALLFLDNNGLSWTVSAPDKVTAVPVRRNGNFQTPISVPEVRPNQCHTVSNLAHRQDYTVACLNYTLQTMMPLPGWPVMAPNAYDNNNNSKVMPSPSISDEAGRWTLNQRSSRSQSSFLAIIILTAEKCPVYHCQKLISLWLFQNCRYFTVTKYESYFLWSKPLIYLFLDCIVFVRV